MQKAHEHNSSKPDAMEELNQIILEHLQSQDDLEFELGDTFDIKTSIALVIIIFLATQSGGFLSSKMPLHWHNIQIASVACVVIAGFLAMFALWPRNYKLKLEPKGFLGWVKEVKEFYGDDKAAVVEFLRSTQIEKIQKRFARNSSINARKSRFMELAFYFTMAALVLNIATLLALSSGWRF
ncbi:MAG: hypothetical protein ACYCPO_06735 [Acidobacteriaceae bacterium]